VSSQSHIGPLFKGSVHGYELAETPDNWRCCIGHNRHFRNCIFAWTAAFRGSGVKILPGKIGDNLQYASVA
jgi:hypothetical protein